MEVGSTCFSRGALRFHKVGNPEVLPVNTESCTAEEQLGDLPEGTKCRTLLVSIAERVVANAHFLSPTTSTPPSQPITVVLSCADECEITSALWLRSLTDCLQTHAVTQPRRLPATPLGPSAYRFLSAVPHLQSAVGDRLTCSEAGALRTRLPGTLLSACGRATWPPAFSHVSSPGSQNENPPDKFPCISADLPPGS